MVHQRRSDHSLLCGRHVNKSRMQTRRDYMLFKVGHPIHLRKCLHEDVFNWNKLVRRRCRYAINSSDACTLIHARCMQAYAAAWRRPVLSGIACAMSWLVAMRPSSHPRQTLPAKPGALRKKRKKALAVRGPEEGPVLPSRCKTVPMERRPEHAVTPWRRAWWRDSRALPEKPCRRPMRLHGDDAPICLSHA